MTESKLLFVEFKNDEPQMHIGIQATDGNNRIVQDMFLQRDELNRWADQLILFPQEQEVVFQYGVTDKEFYGMVRLSAFEHEQGGLCALEIVIDNNSERPFQNKAEFCIRCQRADIRQLGEQILDWDTNKNLMMEWIVKERE